MTETSDVKTGAVLDDRVFAYIASTRPSGPLLANLRRLEFDIDAKPQSHWLQHTRMFLHPGLRTLIMRLSPEDYNVDRSIAIFDEVRLNCPELKHLTLSFAYDPHSAEAALVKLIGSLSGLEGIDLLHTAFSHKSLSVLASLPKLSSIQGHGVKGDRPYLKAENPFAQLNAGVAFPALSCLKIARPLRALHGFLSFSETSLGLTQLTVDMLGVNPAEELGAFLDGLATSCPRLILLQIGHDYEFDLMRLALAEDFGETQPITAVHLQPLIRLSKLETFTLSHTQPVVTTDAELLDICMACPSLTALSLNPEPISNCPTPLTLDVLSLLAENCPKLRVLRLYLDATSPSTLLPVSPVVRFPEFQAVIWHVAHSQIG